MWIAPTAINVHPVFMTSSPRFAAPVADAASLADALQDSCLVCDPYVYGRPRFLTEPLVLPGDFRDALYTASTRVGALYNALGQVLWADPELHRTFFQPTPFQEAMWRASGGDWHVFARLDVFWCDGQFQVCEINADTPSGQSDIAACSDFFGARTHLLGQGTFSDPNAAYGGLLWDAITDLFRARVADRMPERIAIVYPTDLPEDMALVQLYGDWFRARGCQVMLGSPYNLAPTRDGGVALFGMPVDVVLRHYKTDWWGERMPARHDEAPFLDADPLGETELLLKAEHAGKLVTVNPFGAILPQDKRAMAFFWAHMDRFDDADQQTIRDHIPETFMVDDIGKSRLLAERTEWVLKSDFGCEAEEVVIGRDQLDATWHEEVAAVVSGRWVAQRAFAADTIRHPSGRVDVPNYGVYLIGGQPAGIYVRLAPAHQATGHGAVVATPLIEESGDTA